MTLAGVGDRDAPGIDAKSATQGPRKKVVLGVLTFQRPVGLRRVLGGIQELEMPTDDSISFEVVVVDNDAASSAHSVVDDARKHFPWPLEYVVEGERGIARARNRAVAIAMDRCADVVGFIDDDNVPEPGWLVRMLETLQTTDADVLVCRSRPQFERPPPRWMIAGAFFESPPHRTGENIPYYHARTSGALIATRKLPSRQPFDERLALTGGEDVRLFRGIRKDGGKLVWCDEAVVVRRVAQSVASWRWLMKRAFRDGNNKALFFNFEEPKLGRKLKRFGADVARMIGGLVQMLLGLAQGTVGLMRGAQKAASGVGSIMGMFGFKYEEYRHIHGS